MATDRLPVGTVPGVQFNGEQRPLLLRDQESTFLPLLIAPTYDKIVTDMVPGNICGRMHRGFLYVACNNRQPLVHGATRLTLLAPFRQPQSAAEQKAHH